MDALEKALAVLNKVGGRIADLKKTAGGGALSDELEMLSEYLDNETLAIEDFLEASYQPARVIGTIAKKGKPTLFNLPAEVPVYQTIDSCR